MNGLVCKKCEVELQPKQNDVRVIEYFMDPPEPYKLWCADLWACPKCGYEIVTGFGYQAYTEHFRKDFEKRLELAKQNDLVINCFEK